MRTFALFLLLLIAFAAVAQAPPDSHASAQMPTTPNAVVSTIPQLQRIIENARVDLARLRVDKWKADSSVRQQTAANVESLQRNMTNALPGLLTAAQQNPSSLNASFKLYRNLNALYDVMSNVAESAGAFGSKEEYSALARDVGDLDNSRRILGEAMDSLTAQRDAEFTRIQQAARQAAAQTAAAPPKRIVIDDTAPEKKPATKKSTTKKKPATPPPSQQ